MVKNIGFVRRGVRLLVAPWRASSSQVNTKCSGHILVFCHFFVSHTVSTIEAGLMALEDGLSSSLPPRPREERPRGLNPRLNFLSGHNPYILALGKITEDLLR